MSFLGDLSSDLVALIVIASKSSVDSSFDLLNSPTDFPSHWALSSHVEIVNERRGNNDSASSYQHHCIVSPTTVLLPPAKMSAAAPAGGWVKPSLAIVMIASAVARD